MNLSRSNAMQFCSWLTLASPVNFVWWPPVAFELSVFWRCCFLCANPCDVFCFKLALQYRFWYILATVSCCCYKSFPSWIVSLILLKYFPINSILFFSITSRIFQKMKRTSKILHLSIFNARQSLFILTMRVYLELSSPISLLRNLSKRATLKNMNGWEMQSSCLKTFPRFVNTGNWD